MARKLPKEDESVEKDELKIVDKNDVEGIDTATPSTMDGQHRYEQCADEPQTQQGYHDAAPVQHHPAPVHYHDNDGYDNDEDDDSVVDLHFPVPQLDQHGRMVHEAPDEDDQFPPPPPPPPPAPPAPTRRTGRNALPPLVIPTSGQYLLSPGLYHHQQHPQQQQQQRRPLTPSPRSNSRPDPAQQMRRARSYGDFAGLDAPASPRIYQRRAEAVPRHHGSSDNELYFRDEYEPEVAYYVQPAAFVPQSAPIEKKLKRHSWAMMPMYADGYGHNHPQNHCLSACCSPGRQVRSAQLLGRPGGGLSRSPSPFAFPDPGSDRHCQMLYVEDPCCSHAGTPRTASPLLNPRFPDELDDPDNDPEEDRRSRKISCNSRSSQETRLCEVPSDGNRPVVVQFVCPTPAAQEQNALSPAISNRNSVASDTYDTVTPDNSLQTATSTCTTVSNPASNNSLVKADGHMYPQLSGHSPSAPAHSSANGDLAHRGPLPTPENLRKDIFRKNLTTMLSSIYAIFIVMLGGVVYVADVLQPFKNYGEVFTIYLTIFGLSWLGFLHYDIRYFLNSISTWRKQEKRKAFARENPGFDKSMDSMGKPEITLNSMDRSPGAPPLDSYCFKTGRHSGSFYLKIGAAVFCFGHLIHEGLLLSRQIVYFSSDEKFREQCADVIALILSILHPIFSFYQLFMVFKYSNIIINRYRELSRFAIMHIIGANLCLWVNTIIRETQEALAHKVAHGYSNYHSNDTDDDDDDDVTTAVSGLFKVAATMSGVKFDEDSCVSSTILSSFTIQAAPYLYPFTIEYSLLLVGIWFIVWYNIGDTDAMEAEHQHHAQTHPHEGDGSGGETGLSSSETFSSNLVIHVDCHSSNRGLFAGLFVLLATVVSVIIFFVAMTNEQYIQTGIVINNVSDTVLLLLMIFAAAFAYRQTARLDCNPQAITFLDDILLFIALPCFFLYAIFNVVASIAVNNPFNVVISVLCVIQVVIQTPFIVDGLRRCSNSCVLRYKKPGREIITFLVVCNVASWILETFEIKSYDAHSDRIEFYGSFLWTLLSHVTLPLTLFYRFHSSVCLVDMWKSAYEPGDAH